MAGGPEGRVDLADAMTTLGARGLAHVLVEGGSRLLGALVAADLVEEVVVFIAPRLMGPGVPALEPPPEAGRFLPWTLDEPSVRQLGPGPHAAWSTAGSRGRLNHVHRHRRSNGRSGQS